MTRILCTPPGPGGEINPHILAAADLCGIEQIFSVGGAQAIAAMAYGTASIPKVNKLFGPGNAWVTQAKVLVAQEPEGAPCDLPAGPSELMVIADDSARADFVASDLLSQAEHGADSQVLLVTPSAKTLAAVQLELEKQLPKLTRKDVAARALKECTLILADDMSSAIRIANIYAPEHLSLQISEPQAALAQIQNAGSVFLGDWTPEAVGDYASGTNHVLPTYGFARNFSGLSVSAFTKEITIQELTAEGLRGIAASVETLAEVEGLDAHKNAVSIRRKAIENS